MAIIYSFTDTMQVSAPCLFPFIISATSLVIAYNSSFFSNSKGEEHKTQHFSLMSVLLSVLILLCVEINASQVFTYGYE